MPFFFGEHSHSHGFFPAGFRLLSMKIADTLDFPDKPSVHYPYGEKQASDRNRPFGPDKARRPHNALKPSRNFQATQNS